jgi:DNA-binding NarL/FixJ family response regulator
MPQKTARLRVLIADDSAPIRLRIVSLLNEIPRVNAVAETVDVPNTIKEVSLLQPHLIILDLNMPGGNGLDVLEFIRSEKIQSLVIVLTSETDPEYEFAALQAGVIAFLNKSRDFLKLVDVVRELAELTVHPAKHRPFNRVFSSKLSHCH